MLERPRTVTKHCEPEYWTGLHEGCVLVGSLSRYREIESECGLLDDREEGISHNNVEDDIVNFSGNVAGISFKNVNFIGNRTAFTLASTTDANVFCVSSGGYSPHRHQTIINGAVGYRANPLCTAFVEYDLEKLEEAVSYLASIKFGAISRVLSQPVSYDGRIRVVQAANITTDLVPEAINAHAMRSVFLKPSRFSCEEEHRIAFNVGPWKCSPILTTDELRNIRRKFAKAISDPGSIQPK